MWGTPSFFAEVISLEREERLLLSREEERILVCSASEMSWGAGGACNWGKGIKGTGSPS